MKKDKIYSFISIILIVLLLAPIMSYGEFVDMPNNWAKAGLENSIKNGLIQGNNGKIRPKDNLTRGEMAAISSRILGLRGKVDLTNYSDVKSNKWYYDEMSKAVAAGIFEGSNGKLYPEDPIKREEVFVVLGRIFELSQKEEPDKNITDYNNISPWSKEAINSLIDSGYIQGDEKGKINPKGNITREEFATSINNIVGEYVQSSGTYRDKIIERNLLINSEDVKLENIRIKGDLILGEGVHLTDVDLLDVEVEGRVLVRGGKSINLENSNIDTIRVLENVNKLTINLDENSKLDQAITNAKLELKGEGKVEKAIFNTGAEGSQVLTFGTNIETGDDIKVLDEAGNIITAGKTEDKEEPDKEIVEKEEVEDRTPSRRPGSSLNNRPEEKEYTFVKELEIELQREAEELELKFSNDIDKEVVVEIYKGRELIISAKTDKDIGYGIALITLKEAGEYDLVVKDGRKELAKIPLIVIESEITKEEIIKELLDSFKELSLLEKGRTLNEIDKIIASMEGKLEGETKEKLIKARKEYNSLMEEIKEVEDKINKLPEFKELRLEDRDLVKITRAKYNKLSSEQKELIKDLEKLESLEERLEELEKISSIQQREEEIKENARKGKIFIKEEIILELKYLNEFSEETLPKGLNLESAYNNDMPLLLNDEVKLDNNKIVLDGSKIHLNKDDLVKIKVSYDNGLKGKSNEEFEYLVIKNEKIDEILDNNKPTEKEKLAERVKFLNRDIELALRLTEDEFKDYPIKNKQLRTIDNTIEEYEELKKENLEDIDIQINESGITNLIKFRESLKEIEENYRKAIEDLNSEDKGEIQNTFEDIKDPSIQERKEAIELIAKKIVKEVKSIEVNDEKLGKAIDRAFEKVELISEENKKIKEELFKTLKEKSITEGKAYIALYGRYEDKCIEEITLEDLPIINLALEEYKKLSKLSQEKLKDYKNQLENFSNALILKSSELEGEKLVLNFNRKLTEEELTNILSKELKFQITRVFRFGEKPVKMSRKVAKEKGLQEAKDLTLSEVIKVYGKNKNNEQEYNQGGWNSHFNKEKLKVTQREDGVIIIEILNNLFTKEEMTNRGKINSSKVFKKEGYRIGVYVEKEGYKIQLNLNEGDNEVKGKFIK